MTRVKTFDSTGNAPGGRLFAGDLNAIQDQYADQTNLGQVISLGTAVIGEAGLQLLRYGAGEARLSGSLRTDSIVRALGGIYAGAFSTTQRNAIAAGFRPFGLVIFNTTTNQLEINKGTDAAPNWQPVSSAGVEVPVGGVMDWPWAAASIPSWAVLAFNQSVLKTAYPTLDTIASAAGYIYGTDATHFSLPDYRGRIGVGKDDMGGTAANRITVAISGANGSQLGAVFGAEGITLTTAQLPAHNHSVTGAPAHNLTMPDHQHYFPRGNLSVGSGDRSQVMMNDVSGAIDNVVTYGATSLPAINGSVTVGSLATANAGSGNVHQNSQPSIVVNKMMRAL